MQLNVRGFYTDPNYSIDIDFKVFKFIKRQLEEIVFAKYNLNNIHSDTFLIITETTGEDSLEELDVTGPFYRNKKKYITYNIWLPYYPITKSENVREAFVYYYFEGLKRVFSHYGVKEEDIEEVRKIVEKEVVNNPYYDYSHQIVPRPPKDIE